MTHLGNKDTQNYLSSLFFIIGFTFATSYSMTRVDVVDWIHTSFVKRMVRTIIGGLIATAILYGSHFLRNNSDEQDISTFFFFQAVPQLLAGILIYGPYVILCEKYGLVTPYEM